MSFFHEGFWQPMDTLRDKRQLENMWFKNKVHGNLGKWLQNQ